MSLWPDSVVLAGNSIPLAGILAELTIHHGRGDISDDPTATTCQLTLVGVSNALVTAFEVGQSLAVTVRDGTNPPVPRFTGTITDATLADDFLTIIGVGDVSKLRQYEIGAADWPAETWSARVTRCFTEAGLDARLELYPEPGFDPMLVGRTTATAGTTTLGDYLAFLAAMIGAAVTDRPNGDFLVQAIGSRSIDNATPIDPDDVEFAPAWQSELPRGNIVTVRYTGDQSEHVTVVDDASIDLYGPRPETIDTTFANVADATTRATTRLGRGAFSHWNIPEAPILRGLELELGSPVMLTAMPPASPADPWNPILEGWTDEITGPNWRMTLALSDPLLSGAILPWNGVPVADVWSNIDPATDWTEALTIDDLEPA